MEALKAKQQIGKILRYINLKVNIFMLKTY